MKHREASLSHETLTDLLDYNPETGVFTWKKVNSNRAKVGSEAGFKFKSGRRAIEICGMRYYAHRLAWFYVHGKWPEHEIDHINRNGGDNRLANLREATHQQNNFNKGARSGTGYKGVSKTKNGKFIAQIMKDGRNKYLGIFDTPEAAHEKYVEASQEHHQDFGRVA